MNRFALAIAAACALSACAQAPVGSIGATTTVRNVGGTSGSEPMMTFQERLDKNPIEQDHRNADTDFRKHQAAALEGNAESALRVADMYAKGSNGVPQSEQRMLQWLLHASALNNGTASYRLYQYYLAKGLDRDAVFFENRAVGQGFVLPTRLDPRRGQG